MENSKRYKQHSISASMALCHIKIPVLLRAFHIARSAIEDAYFTRMLSRFAKKIIYYQKTPSSVIYGISEIIFHPHVALFCYSWYRDRIVV